MLRVRSCRDPGVLGRIHRATVATAYAGFFPSDATLPSHDEFRVMWEQRLAERGVAAFVATLDDRPAGLAAIGPSMVESGGGELLGLFVDPTRVGQGLGSALHDVALGALADAGVSLVGLWVIAANLRARAFYESRRWRLVPRMVYEPYPGVPEVRYEHHGGD